VQRSSRNHWIGSWAPESVLELWRREKSFCPCRETNPGLPASIPSLYRLRPFGNGLPSFEKILETSTFTSLFNGLRAKNPKSILNTALRSLRECCAIPDRLCGLVVRVPDYRSRGPGFDFRRYHIFWEVVGLERGPLSLVRITEELLEWKSSGSVLENREYGCGDSLRWPRDTLYPQKLALTLPTIGGRSVGIFLLRAKVMEFVCFVLYLDVIIPLSVSLKLDTRRV
jgi:hypothetical protein